MPDEQCAQYQLPSTFDSLDTDPFKKQSFSKTRGPKISQMLLKILHLQKSMQI